MRKPAAVFPIALALGATILVPEASAREPTPIKACQTISQPGSYELAGNLTATGDCLVITTDFVTIDLAGFLISGAANTGVGIGFAPKFVGHEGFAVRNGSISGFQAAVDVFIGPGAQIVEGLRVFGAATGIAASGIVKGNTVQGVGSIGILATGTVTGNYVNATGNTGIVATGTVTGNYVATSGNRGFDIGIGSTVIGNTAIDNVRFGISVGCPSKLTDNTAVNNGTNLELFNEGCHVEDNVAP
jgi:hypothetical protein